MHVLFLFNATVFGAAVIVVALMAMGIVPGPTKTIDTWIATRPTIARRWLVVAFWGNLVLAFAAGGLLVGTTGQVLPAIWSDVAQSLVWLAMATDAAIVKKWLWLVVSVIFLAFSIYEVATHL